MRFNHITSEEMEKCHICECVCRELAVRVCAGAYFFIHTDYCFHAFVFQLFNVNRETERERERERERQKDKCTDIKIERETFILLLNQNRNEETQKRSEDIPLKSTEGQEGS